MDDLLLSEVRNDGLMVIPEKVREVLGIEHGDIFMSEIVNKYFLLILPYTPSEQFTCNSMFMEADEEGNIKLPKYYLELFSIKSKPVKCSHTLDEEFGWYIRILKTPIKQSD